jgi:large subunit ribosomal protein L24
VSSKIRKGDNVVVLSGRDKGRRGIVLKVLTAERQVIVEGVNKVKKHTRPNPQTNTQGGIIDKEMPMPMGKVELWNPSAKKGDRVGFKTLADGKKVRIFKSNGEMIDV